MYIAVSKYQRELCSSLLARKIRDNDRMRYLQEYVRDSAPMDDYPIAGPNSTAEAGSNNEERRHQ